MRQVAGSIVIVFWVAVCACGQPEPPNSENPQTQPATQPASQPADPQPPQPLFKLGGAPPRDDGRTRFPVAVPATLPDTPRPQTRPVEASREPENPAPRTRPATAPATQEASVPATAPATAPATQEAAAPATRPEVKGPFKLGDPNVNLPKPNPEVAQTKPADPRKNGGAAAAGAADPLVMKEIPFAHPDFPPGLFSDGNLYRLADLQGKVIVLFFFDSSDERVLATIPQRNALVRKFRDKPVVFFGVENDTIQNVQHTVRYLNLQMPVFADTLGVMMARYNVRLNGATTWNVCIINGAGKATHEEMTEAALEKALVGAKWKYRDKLAVDPRLAPALEALEMGEYERGIRLAALWANHVDKRAAESARSLLAILRDEAQDWKRVADAVAPTESLRAYDLYARIMLACAGTDMARSVADPLKKLSNHREVRPELAARGMYKVLCNAVSRDEGIEKWDAVGYCEEIIRVAPGSATSDQLVKYLADLGKVRERGVYGPRQYRRGRD